MPGKKPPGVLKTSLVLLAVLVAGAATIYVLGGPSPAALAEGSRLPSDPELPLYTFETPRRSVAQNLRWETEELLFGPVPVSRGEVDILFDNGGATAYEVVLNGRDDACLRVEPGNAVMLRARAKLGFEVRDSSGSRVHSEQDVPLGGARSWLDGRRLWVYNHEGRHGYRLEPVVYVSAPFGVTPSGGSEAFGAPRATAIGEGSVFFEIGRVNYLFSAPTEEFTTAGRLEQWMLVREPR